MIELIVPFNSTFIVPEGYNYAQFTLVLPTDNGRSIRSTTNTDDLTNYISLSIVNNKTSLLNKK